MLRVPVHLRPCVDQGQGIHSQPAFMLRKSVELSLCVPLSRPFQTIQQMLINTFVAKALIEESLGVRLVLQPSL